MINISGVRNLTNQKFGMLTAIKRVENHKNGKTQWECTCDCGNTTIVQTYLLTKGITKSCGCKSGEKHGMTGTRLYEIWVNMKTRCYNKNNIAYKNWYGDRGIKICDEWHHSFTNFYKWAIKNGYEDNLTIDRIDVNGNYEPSNCRWITMKKQCNNKRDNIYLTINNETHTLKEWCGIKDVSYTMAFQRYQQLEDKDNIDYEDLFDKTPKDERLFTYNNETRNLRQWAKYFNIDYKLFMGRFYRHGFNISELTKLKCNNWKSRKHEQ